MTFNASSTNQSHPCVKDGCTMTVPFDDEPYCFTHSPDSGSNVRGYSYKAEHCTREVLPLSAPIGEYCDDCGELHPLTPAKFEGGDIYLTEDGAYTLAGLEERRARQARGE